MAKYVTEPSKDYSIVDNKTGELLPYNQVRKIEPNEFIMVFLENCRPLMDLRGNDLKVLICCWEYATYNSVNEQKCNIVYTGPGFKEACKKHGLNIPNASIDNAISTLCKKGLMIRLHRGEYKLNTQFFFKGRLSSRNKPAPIQEDAQSVEQGK